MRYHMIITILSFLAMPFITFQLSTASNRKLLIMTAQLDYMMITYDSQDGHLNIINILLSSKTTWRYNL